MARISYYRLSAYWHPFKHPDDTFIAGATFERAIELYEFDRRLRLCVFDAIQRVEILLRTKITYQLGHRHGAFAHEDARNFDHSWAVGHRDWIDSLRKETHRARENFLGHFRSKYNGFPSIPIWMASEVMSFGSLSLLFENMLTGDRLPIAGEFGVTAIVAVSWLRSLSYVRNVCAHHGRLWNRELSIKPLLPKKDPTWQFGNTRVFCVLSILRHLTKPVPGGEQWAQDAARLLQSVDKDRLFATSMGLPSTWTDHSLWKSPLAASGSCAQVLAGRPACCR
ncbi:MAG: Abi family protein [Myxococcales bacterium]